MAAGAGRRFDRQPEAMRPRRVLAALLAVGSLVSLSGQTVQAQEEVELGDVIRGWQIFHEKHCVRCHAVWGEGGQVGPDLGRVHGKHLSAVELASGMWNHVPRMLALVRQYHLPEITLTRDEMGDMFAFLYFVRYLDEPGDPQRGVRVLEEKKCATCHALEHSGGEIGPDLTRWAGYVNPIVWAQMMWEHSTGMESAMQAANIERPQLDDRDLINIIAFVRSVGAAAQKTYLRPGSPARGRQLFAERGCGRCHLPDENGQRKGPDLSRVALPTSMAALASRMWNHLPAMRKVMAEQNIKVQALTAQDMADIIAYIFALQYEGVPGDPERGKRVFQQKRCAECHTLSATEPASPEVASAAGLGHAVWKHGAVMAEMMARAGIPWPTFEGSEMADLIAYIRSVGKLVTVKPAGETPGAPQGQEKRE